MIIDNKGNKVLVVPNQHFGIAICGQIVSAKMINGTSVFVLKNASTITQTGIGPDWALIAKSPNQRTKMNSTRCPNGRIKVWFQFGYVIEWRGDLPS